MQQLDRNNMLETAKQDAVRTKIDAEKVERDAQIKRDEDRRKKERNDEEENDKSAVRKLEEEIEREKAVERQRKVQDKLWQDKLLAENQVKLQEKNKHKIKLMAEEQKIIEE